MGMKMVLARSPEVGFSPCIFACVCSQFPRTRPFGSVLPYKPIESFQVQTLVWDYLFSLGFRMHSCYILLQLKLWAETFTFILAQGTKQKAAFRIRVLRVLRVSPISWSTLPRARPEMNCNLTACLGYVESNDLAKLRRKVQVITYSQLCQRFCQRFSRCKQWQCNAVVAFVRQHWVVRRHAQFCVGFTSDLCWQNDRNELLPISARVKCVKNTIDFAWSGMI